MGREADYTIKGFLYQFNKTLIKLLDEPDTNTIIVEGIVEDIDVHTPSGLKVIQCKYHETIDKFRLSDITKPVLQMLSHFADNSNSSIEYILYAYFEGESPGIKPLTEEDIESILSTNNKDYIVSYIPKIIKPADPTIDQLVKKDKKTSDEKNEIVRYYRATQLAPCIDIGKFLQVFILEFGKSFEQISIDVKNKLVNEGFSKEDVDELFYPNAIQRIAELSIMHCEEDRKITKRKLLAYIKETKKTAITRWTRELQTYDKLLKKRREQLHANLQKNIRSRYFIIDPEMIDDFDDNIITFLQEFIEKYNFKIKLHPKTPVFCFDTASIDFIADLHERLYMKNISIETGYRGNKFFEEAFFKEPLRIIADNSVEFKLRVCTYNDSVIKALNSKKGDDLFIISRKKYEELDTRDVNVERLEINSIDELRYLLYLTNGGISCLRTG